MWVKLGSEYLNLDHVVRVKFNRSWKNGQDELVAEVEGLIKGETQVFIRYRGVEAEALQAVLRPRVSTAEAALGILPAAEPMAPAHSLSNTLHDVKIP